MGKGPWRGKPLERSREREESILRGVKKREERWGRITVGRKGGDGENQGGIFFTATALIIGEEKKG